MFRLSVCLFYNEIKKFIKKKKNKFLLDAAAGLILFSQKNKFNYFFSCNKVFGIGGGMFYSPNQKFYLKQDRIQILDIILIVMQLMQE